MIQLLRHLMAFSLSFSLCFYLVPIMIKAANKLKLLDAPDGKIKRQKSPVPYLGGVAIYLAFIISLAFVYPFENRMLWFIIGTTVLLFVGLFDDLISLRPKHKFIGQIVSVACLLRGGIALKTAFFSDVINLAASGFWMLSVINAINLVDVMDGLAALLATISIVSFAVIALLLQQYYFSLLLFALLGALLAFFFYNKPSARIYLGDAGSLFIGGAIASIPLLFRWTKILHDHNAFPIFAQGYALPEIAVSAMMPILLVGVPLIEITSLVVIRKYKGLPVYCGSPHHFSSYLCNRGWSAWQILLFAGAAAVVLSIFAITFMFGFLPFWWLIGSLFLFGVIWLRVVFR